MTPTQLREEYWGMDIPNPQHAIIHGNTITWEVNGAKGKGFIVLPPGSWQIVCLSKEVTEEVAAQIVEGNHNAYIDYERDFHGIPLRVFTAVESSHSLIRSKGLDPNNTLILKKL